MNKSKLIKTIILFLIILCLAISPVLSVEESTIDFDDDPSLIGSADYTIEKEQGESETSFFESLFQFSTFTIIGGANCEFQPDIAKSYSPSSSSITSLCTTNSDHSGMAVILYDEDYKWLATNEIEEGEKVCHDVEYGQDYYYEIYYCDDALPRSCSDTDGGRFYYTAGSVTVDLGDESNTISDFCVDSNTIVEVFCDGDTSDAISKECACSNGVCIPEDEDSSDEEQKASDEAEAEQEAQDEGKTSVDNEFMGSIIDPVSEATGLSSFQIWSIFGVLLLMILGVYVFGRKK